MTLTRESMNKPTIFIVTVAVVLLAVVVIALYLSSVNQPQFLYPAEVRNYQGENLSSIAGVKENNIAGIQFINVSTYKLTVTGLVNKTLQLTYDDAINNHQSYLKVVTIRCVEGWEARILWQGILVKDLLQEAGPSSNATVAIFYASDGYSTALPIDYLTNKNILIAYKMNNVTMPPERGFPFELVAESQYGYKWIKWLTKIEVSNNTGYLGFWERQGYPNNATIR